MSAPDKHGEIVDAICREAGIERRRRPLSTNLDKKEALHVHEFIRTLKELRHGA